MSLDAAMPRVHRGMEAQHVSILVSVSDVRKIGTVLVACGLPGANRGCSRPLIADCNPQLKSENTSSDRAGARIIDFHGLLLTQFQQLGPLSRIRVVASLAAIFKFFSCALASSTTEPRWMSFSMHDFMNWPQSASARSLLTAL